MAFYNSNVFRFIQKNVFLEKTAKIGGTVDSKKKIKKLK